MVAEAGRVVVVVVVTVVKLRSTWHPDEKRKNCRNGRKLKFNFSACNLWPRKIDYHQSVSSDLGSLLFSLVGCYAW